MCACETGYLLFWSWIEPPVWLRFWFVFWIWFWSRVRFRPLFQSHLLLLGKLDSDIKVDIEIGGTPRFWIFFYELNCSAVNFIQNFTFNTHSNDPKKSTAKNYFLCPIFKTNFTKLIFILPKYTNPKLARSNYWMQSSWPDKMEVKAAINSSTMQFGEILCQMLVSKKDC